jgi:acyl-CoA thioesterase
MDFLADTGLRPLGPGRFEATITQRWWIVLGPNGGLLAALLLRAVQAGVERADVVPRTMTIQYLAAPVPGPVELVVDVERAGRRVTFVAVQMVQDGKRLCQARVVLATDLGDDHAMADLRMPEVPGPAELPLWQDHENGEARKRWQRRIAFDRDGVAGGWLRMEPPVPLDHPGLACMCDNWPPSIRTHRGRLADADRIHTTTLELTVYFRTARIEVRPEDPCLVILRSQTAAEGFHQEDGEVWSPDGRLLATSRQLAIMFVRDEIA